MEKRGISASPLSILVQIRLRRQQDLLVAGVSDPLGRLREGEPAQLGYFRLLRMLLSAGGDGGEEDHVLDGPRFGGVGDLLAERRVDIRGQPGLLQDFPGGGLRLRLVSLHVALGEAPVPAVVPDQQILPFSGLPPPDHRAAGFFLQSLTEDAAVSTGPVPAVGSQIEVPLGNAQVYQGEGPRAAEPHPDGAVRTAGEPGGK